MHWTAAEWTTFLGALATVFAAIAAATIKVLDKIKEIHLAINSRMDELVAETRKASLAEGRDQMRLNVNPPVTITDTPAVVTTYPPITESMGIKPPTEKP